MTTNAVKTVDEYVQFLTDKGFHFGEEELGFISFGQRYSATSDDQVIAAIEITLKAQRHFDGSYFVALLEQLKGENITNRKDSFQYAKQKGILRD
ncbi:DUF6123 family protein [Bacillus sp. DJP31]|uniref:DUF6123 family protein n=1 Tax=Bacillus sp. DJP31 TaxID=3409789 RepID=UPI003BB61023